MSSNRPTINISNHNNIHIGNINVAPNYLPPNGNLIPGMGLLSQPFASNNFHENVYFDQRNGNFGFLGKGGVPEMGQFADAHLNEFFYQELVPQHKKTQNPDSIFEKYKQTNKLENIEEENSYQESESLNLSKPPRDSLSFSSPENLKKIHFDERSANFVKAREPWELESRAFAKDVFFDALESQSSGTTRKRLNVSGSLNLVSPVNSSLFLALDKSSPTGPRPNSSIGSFNEAPKAQKESRPKPESPKIKRQLYKKKPKTTVKPKLSPLVQKRRKDVSIDRKKPVFDELPTNLPKKMLINAKRVPLRSKEKVVVSRSKSPVTTAYKKILLANTSKNLDIKEVVQKSLQKNQRRRLSLSPDSGTRWTLSRHEFKNLRKKLSLQVLTPKKFGSARVDVKKQFRIKSMVLKGNREASGQK